MEDQFIIDAEYFDMCETSVAAELATLRADIAEELARALEQAEEVMRMLEGKPVSRMTEAEKAIMMLDRGPLARYRAITP